MPDPNLETQLREALMEIARADVSGIDLDEDLVLVLGLDSLAGLRMLAALEKRFAVRFPDHRLGELRTMRQLLEVMERSPGGSP